MPACCPFMPRSRRTSKPGLCFRSLPGLPVAARAPQRVDYRVIYPEASGPAGLLHAARKKVSSFSVRRVLRDEQSEQKVWSSLVLAYGSRPEVLIQGVEAGDLPYLEGLIVENLKSLDRPPRPVFAVAAPAGFQLLSSFLSEYGRVTEVDLNAGAAIPQEADVLFWMQPATATPTPVRELRRVGDAGRAAVLRAPVADKRHAPRGGGWGRSGLPRHRTPPGGLLQQLQRDAAAGCCPCYRKLRCRDTQAGNRRGRLAPRCYSRTSGGERRHGH